MGAELLRIFDIAKESLFLNLISLNTDAKWNVFKWFFSRLKSFVCFFLKENVNVDDCSILVSITGLRL